MYTVFETLFNLIDVQLNKLMNVKVPVMFLLYNMQ